VRDAIGINAFVGVEQADGGLFHFNFLLVVSSRKLFTGPAQW
jgi:hypothetical protein